MPRSEIRDILHRFRRIWRKQNRRIVHQLHWHHPGAVWAADHLQPAQAIDGKFPYALVVRDLASHFQLAWLPVPNNDAHSTAAVLSTLFEKHGPPLVLKTDNGSAFIAEHTCGLLKSQSVLHLPSPARTPQYNGSCEAAGGSS
jgi:transposase InsO family protein